MARRPQLQPGTAELTAPPAVAEYFGAARWQVRQLTGVEVYRMRAAGTGDQEQLIKAIADSLTSGAGRGELAAEVATGGKVPPELRRQIAMIEYGLTSPQLDHGQIVTLYEHWPMFADQLAGQIALLTGEGASLVKPSRSTPIPASEPA